MPPPTLGWLAKNACILNLRQIDDVGDAPYYLIRPVLQKLENPRQLRTIEKNSPQICGADAELWQNFIKRDVPNWKSKNYEPKDPKNWHKVYAKLRREADEELQEQEAKLKAALQKKTAEKQNHQMTFIDKPIDQRKRKPQQALPFNKATPGSMVSYKGGSRGKALTGSSILQKIRKESRQSSIFSARDKILAEQKRAAVAPVSRPAPKASSVPSRPPVTTTKPLGPPAPGTEPSSKSQPAKRPPPRKPETTTDFAKRSDSPSRASPRPPTPAGPRKRPAPSIFMPDKRLRTG